MNPVASRSALKIAFVVVGAFCEVLGIVLVGSPELVEYRHRAANRLGRWWERTAARIIVFLGGTPPTRATLLLSSKAVPKERSRLDFDPESVPRNPEQERRFIRRFAQAVIDRLYEIEVELERTHVWATNRANDVASQLADEIDRKMKAERDSYLPQRALGIPLLVIGSGLLAAANFA